MEICQFIRIYESAILTLFELKSCPSFMKVFIEFFFDGPIHSHPNEKTHLFWLRKFAVRKCSIPIKRTERRFSSIRQLFMPAQTLFSRKTMNFSLYFEIPVLESFLVLKIFSYAHFSNGLSQKYSDGQKHKKRII